MSTPGPEKIPEKCPRGVALPGVGLANFRSVMAGWLLEETRTIQDGPAFRVGRRKDNP